MARAQTMDAPLIFVLGDPNYYGRFAFSTDAAATFECAYAGPHFMALRLSSYGTERGRGCLLRALFFKPSRR